jgi:hypothetical protein
MPLNTPEDRRFQISSPPDLLIVLVLIRFIFASACSVYVKFVGYNLKDLRHCHVCDCQLTPPYKTEIR